jgi:uncharacterized protein (UPF0147 family)
MAAKSKRAAKSAKKAGEAASSLRSNPYVQRLIEDDELRDNLRDAVESARDAYARIANGKGPAAIMEDKKVQKDLRHAAESLREASEQLRGKRKKSRLGKIILIALLGGIVAVLLSEDIRKALLDKLFGAEEEFEYSSTTSPSSSATPASTASGSSS